MKFELLLEIVICLINVLLIIAIYFSMKNLYKEYKNDQTKHLYSNSSSVIL